MSRLAPSLAVWHPPVWWPCYYTIQQSVQIIMHGCVTLNSYTSSANREKFCSQILFQDVLKACSLRTDGHLIRREVQSTNSKILLKNLLIFETKEIRHCCFQATNHVQQAFPIARVFSVRERYCSSIICARICAISTLIFRNVWWTSCSVGFWYVYRAQ